MPFYIRVPSLITPVHCITQTEEPTKLNSEQLIILIEIIEANNDATLEELSDLLYEKTQVKVSRATLGRITQKLKYSFKKKHYTRRKKKVKGYSKKEWNTGPK
jgi:transposase